MSRSVDRLVEIMAALRSETGCPWDREQTHQTLRPYLIEEAYEVLDAIETGDDGAFCEELGDLLLQVVFHAQIAEEAQRFDLDAVADRIVDKLIRRHPHVFGDVKADTASEVLENWEKIKRAEKSGVDGSILDGVPGHLPALLQAYRIQEKAERVNFDWTRVEDVIRKVREEFDELDEAVGRGDRTRLEEEFGDLLFSMVNLARHVRVTPEDALRKSNRKFIDRFRYIEKTLRLNGESLEDASFERLDALWEEAKRHPADKG
ncbi:MAG: nucleoside triphosphate pyrophosphohydrolase [candidate division Zixibacteria bacterium]|nr:nucleoside triphosphate pyrophosphohydrolase [candidate division Zixibacteria bacterium]